MTKISALLGASCPLALFIEPPILRFQQPVKEQLIRNAFPSAVFGWPRSPVRNSQGGKVRGHQTELIFLEFVCDSCDPVSATGHLRRFLRGHATSGYPPKLTVKADLADWQSWADAVEKSPRHPADTQQSNHRSRLFLDRTCSSEAHFESILLRDPQKSFFSIGRYRTKRRSRIQSRAGGDLPQVGQSARTRVHAAR